jgi:hypothetical protein
MKRGRHFNMHSKRIDVSPGSPYIFLSSRALRYWRLNIRIETLRPTLCGSSLGGAWTRTASAARRDLRGRSRPLLLSPS